MSATTTTTQQTTQAPVSSYHVPVQDVDYNKEYVTTGTGAYTTQPMVNPGVGAVTYPNYQALSQAVPGVSIFLRPIAAPSALGWMSFFAGTFTLFTWFADWYGGEFTYADIAPFLFFFAGLCQLVAGFHGYNARDNFATVWFPLWGSFFLAYAYWSVYIAGGALQGVALVDFGRHTENQGLAMWFVILTGVSWACCLPAFARDITTGIVVLLAAIGSTLELAFFSNHDGNRNTIKAGAYFLLVSGCVALFRGWLYLLEEAFYETPLGTRFLPQYRTPLQNASRSPVSVGVNEPGVRKGQ